jgi:hypothetical protein
VSDPDRKDSEAARRSAEANGISTDPIPQEDRERARDFLRSEGLLRSAKPPIDPACECDAGWLELTDPLDSTVTWREPCGLCDLGLWIEDATYAA